jgi:hypothetical protein
LTGAETVSGSPVNYLVMDLFKAPPSGNNDSTSLLNPALSGFAQSSEGAIRTISRFVGTGELLVCRGEPRRGGGKDAVAMTRSELKEFEAKPGNFVGGLHGS